jgi:hypothetical protein
VHWFRPPSRLHLRAIGTSETTLLWQATVWILKHKEGVGYSGIRKFKSKLCNYVGVSKSFRTGRLELELQMVQLSATRCSCVAILWVSLVSFVYYCKRIFRYRLSPETFGYTLVSYSDEFLVLFAACGNERKENKKNILTSNLWNV